MCSAQRSAAQGTSPHQDPAPVPVQGAPRLTGRLVPAKVIAVLILPAACGAGKSRRGGWRHPVFGLSDSRLLRVSSGKSRQVWACPDFQIVWVVASFRNEPAPNRVKQRLIREILGRNRTVNPRQGAMASPVRARLLHMAEGWACPDVLLGVLCSPGSQEGLWPIRGALDTASVSPWGLRQPGVPLDVASLMLDLLGQDRPPSPTSQMRSSTACMLPDPSDMYC